MAAKDNKPQELLMAQNSSSYILANLSDADYEYDGDGFMTHMEAPGTRVILRVVLPIICVFGILGILLTVVVLSKKNMHTSTNSYLMALSVADLIFLILLATVLAEECFVPNTTPFFNYMIYATFAAIFMNIFLLTSIWVTVMLAVERYIAICQPFLATKLCTVQKAWVIIAIIFVVAFLCRLPNFWENSIVTVYDTFTNQSWAYPAPNNFSENEHYVSIYPWAIDGVVTSIVPFLLLLVLNAALIWEVKKSTKYMASNLGLGAKSAATAQREERQITFMLIGIIIVFFICQAPYVIYTAIVSMLKTMDQYAVISPGFMLFRSITMLLLTLKSAINFIIYCWFSEKFRATLKRTLCREWCLSKLRKKPQNGSYLNLRRYSNTTRDTSM